MFIPRYPLASVNARNIWIFLGIVVLSIVALGADFNNSTLCANEAIYVEEFKRTEAGDVISSPKIVMREENLSLDLEDGLRGVLRDLPRGSKVLQIGCHHTRLLAEETVKKSFDAYCVNIRSSSGSARNSKVHYPVKTTVFELLPRSEMDLVYSLQSLEDAIVPSAAVQGALRVTKQKIVLLERNRALTNTRIVESASSHDSALHTWPRLLIGNLLVANGFREVVVEDLGAGNLFCTLSLTDLVKTALSKEVTKTSLIKAAEEGIDHCPLMAKAVKPPANSEHEAAEHYNADYWEYQLKSALENNPQNVAENVQKLFKQDFATDPEFTFLDIGCGGGFTPGLVGAPKALCIELNPFARAHGMKNFTNVKYFFPDEWYKIPDKSVDFVWSVAVLEHVPDYIDALSHVVRVLKPGGSAHIRLPAETTRNNLPPSANDVDMHLHTWNAQHLWNAAYFAGMRGHVVTETQSTTDYCTKPVKELFKNGPTLEKDLKRWAEELGDHFFYCYTSLTYQK
mmetsp:Transcript_13215/g.57605  ORF Transcript_13215/g.57605 Transcript_13215/m.57605 type:complete len:512 (-) Transcript_13215:899-2434(-)